MKDYYIIHDEADAALAIDHYQRKKPGKFPSAICIKLNAKVMYEGLTINTLEFPDFQYVDLPIQAALAARRIEQAGQANFHVVTSKPRLPRACRALARLRISHSLVCTVSGVA